MSLVQLPEAAPTDTFVGGTWFADQPPSEIQVFGFRKYPSWPFLSQSKDLQMICVVNFTTTDLNKAAKDFLDVSELASKMVGYVCNSDIILDAQYGQTACTFSVTTTPRPVGALEAVREFSPRDTVTRQVVGNDLMVMMANELMSRGHRCLNERPPATS